MKVEEFNFNMKNSLNATGTHPCVSEAALRALLQLCPLLRGEKQKKPLPKILGWERFSEEAL